MVVSQDPDASEEAKDLSRPRPRPSLSPAGALKSLDRDAVLALVRDNLDLLDSAA